MSDDGLIHGEANIAKYMQLLDSERDLKEKLQQLYHKKVADDQQNAAEIQRLQELLQAQEEQLTNQMVNPDQSAEEINRLSAQLNEKDLQLDSLKNDLEKVMISAKELTSQKEEINQLNSLVAEKDQQIAAISQQLTDELEEKDQQILALSESLSTLQESTSESEEIKQLKDNLRVSNGKLNACREAFYNLEEKTKEKDKEFKKLSKQLQAQQKVDKKITTKNNTSSTGKKPVKSVTNKADTKKADTKAGQSNKSKKNESKVDDLTQIKGIGPKISQLLQAEGVNSFAQIASWKQADIKDIDSKLKFKGRIKRDDWIKQAKKLSKQ